MQFNAIHFLSWSIIKGTLEKKNTIRSKLQFNPSPFPILFNSNSPVFVTCTIQFNSFVKKDRDNAIQLMNIIVHSTGIDWLFFWPSICLFLSGLLCTYQCESPGWPKEFWWRKGLSVRISHDICFHCQKAILKYLHFFHLRCQNDVKKNCCW